MASQSALLCSASIGQLNRENLSNLFNTRQGEIQFYKEIKPAFYSHLLFFQKLFKVESSRPIGEPEDVRMYFRNQLQKLKTFFEENQFFFTYYRAGDTSLDENLFLRKEKRNHSLLIPGLSGDNGLSSGMDILFSEIKATYLLESYIHKALIDAQTIPANHLPTHKPAQISLTWTDPKTSLIELAYALHAAGSFNHGKADLKLIIEFFQSHLHVELGNTSRTFQEILSRKTGYTNYIDHLKNKLLNRIDKLH